MKNERMGLEKWSKMKFDSARIFYRAGERELGDELLTLMPPIYGKREFYMMMPVVYCKYSLEVIFFYQCEYCREHILDDNDCCKSCGAPAEM
jgi:hypothetical protein